MVVGLIFTKKNNLDPSSNNALNHDFSFVLISPLKSDHHPTIWLHKLQKSTAVKTINSIKYPPQYLGLNFCLWKCQFQISAYEIAMAIPKAEVRNSIFAQKIQKGAWNSELLPLESPWQFHKQKFVIVIYIDRSLGPKFLKSF